MTMLDQVLALLLVISVISLGLLVIGIAAGFAMLPVVGPTLRERLAIRLIDLATWALPENHPAILPCYHVASIIEEHSKQQRRDPQ